MKIEGQTRIPSRCAISADISKDGNKMSGEMPGAYVFSSGRNMDTFKTVGFPEDLGIFYKLVKYIGFTWTLFAGFSALADCKKYISVIFRRTVPFQNITYGSKPYNHNIISPYSDRHSDKRGSIRNDTAPFTLALKIH